MSISLKTHGIGFCIFASLLLVPQLAFGQADYVDLAPLPGISESGGTFSGYLSGVFRFTIGIAVALAVLMIALGGVKYMSTDAVSGKRDGLDMLNAAIGGLILIALSWLILRTINPGLLNFSLNVQPAPDAPQLTQNEILAAGDEDYARYFDAIDEVYAQNLSISNSLKLLREKVKKIETDIILAESSDENIDTSSLRASANRITLEISTIAKFETVVSIWNSTLANANHAMRDGSSEAEITEFMDLFATRSIGILKYERDALTLLLNEYTKAGGVKIDSQMITTYINQKVSDLIRYVKDLYNYRSNCPKDKKVIMVNGVPQDIDCLVNNEPKPSAPTMRSFDNINAIANIES